MKSASRGVTLRRGMRVASRKQPPPSLRRKMKAPTTEQECCETRQENLVTYTKRSISPPVSPRLFPSHVAGLLLRITVKTAATFSAASPWRARFLYYLTASLGCVLCVLRLRTDALLGIIHTDAAALMLQSLGTLYKSDIAVYIYTHTHAENDAVYVRRFRRVCCSVCNVQVSKSVSAIPSAGVFSGTGDLLNAPSFFFYLLTHP